MIFTKKPATVTLTVAAAPNYRRVVLGEEILDYDATIDGFPAVISFGCEKIGVCVGLENAERRGLAISPDRYVEWKLSHFLSYKCDSFTGKTIQVDLERVVE